MLEYNEKAYRKIGTSGGSSIAIGICLIVFGITAGVLSIVSGANALKSRKFLID